MIVKNNPSQANQQGETTTVNGTTPHYNPASTDTHSQRAKILELLAERPRNTFEFRENGIMHPSARISELRDKGYNIQTVKVNQQHSTYKHKNVALYVLHGGKK